VHGFAKKEKHFALMGHVQSLSDFFVCKNIHLNHDVVVCFWWGAAAFEDLYGKSVIYFKMPY
jgi:hypothetical protein